MKLEDLPAADQRVIRAGAIRATGAARGTRAVRSAGQTGTARPAAGRPDPSHRCETCQDTFPSYPAAERHVDGTHAGVGRIGMVLP